jgi:Raf kinase inhibitor-like YbhB/YbcL family protein
MNHKCARFIAKFLSVCFTLTLIMLTLAACDGSKEKTLLETPPIPSLSLNSTAFQDTGSIPVKYTCSGQNVSPPLSWGTPPQGTQTFALVMLDLDAGGFTHWVLFNLPSDISELQEAISPQGQLPAGAFEGKNSFGKIGYGGPCPPSGRSHRYEFAFYAIDQSLDLKAGASKDQVLEAMQGHVLAVGKLTSTYQR